MKIKTIEKALKDGFILGCWASGGRVPIVAVMNNKNKTVASGEGGVIQESFTEANINFQKYFKSKKKARSTVMLMTGAQSDKSNLSIFGWLDHWVKIGSGELRAYYDNYSNVFIVKLDGYNDNVDRVIQLGFNQDLIRAIELAHESPKILLN